MITVYQHQIDCRYVPLVFRWALCTTTGGIDGANSRRALFAVQGLGFRACYNTALVDGMSGVAGECDLLPELPQASDALSALLGPGAEPNANAPAGKSWEIAERPAR